MIIDKGLKVNLGEGNFSSLDFDCKCKNKSCTTTEIDNSLVKCLDELFSIAEFRITSGYRCKKHNTAVGGKDGSLHLVGRAVDIESTNGLSGPELSKYVLQIEPLEKGGLGVAQGWLHTDNRTTRARWTYPNTH